jgi:hypothetical protein
VVESCRVGNYLAKPLTVAWRRVLLPARCLTVTTIAGLHHWTSKSLDDLKTAHDVLSCSSWSKKADRSSQRIAMNAAPA